MKTKAELFQVSNFFNEPIYLPEQFCSYRSCKSATVSTFKTDITNVELVYA